MRNVEMIIDKLTDDERESLFKGLMKRVRTDAKNQAIVIADLLEADLNVAGFREEGKVVREIRRKLLDSSYLLDSQS